MADRPTFTSFMTPKGTFVYPKLNEPDTKFKAEGEFATKVNFDPEDIAPFLAKLEKEQARALEAARNELKEKLAAATKGADKGKLKKQLDELKAGEPPVKPVFDDDGNETGEVQINFKMPAQVTFKKGPKAGQSMKLRPDIFDAKGKLLKNPPPIWGGTIGIIAGEFRPYYTEKAGAGVSLRLKAVQVVVLQSGSGSRDAGSYGFGAEEGYEADDEATNGGFQDQSGTGDEGDDGSSGPAANAF